MIPRAMDQVFAAAAELAPQGWRYEMKASMLEIYNEELRDLLGKGPPAGKKHAVRGVLGWLISAGGWMAVNGWVGGRAGGVALEGRGFGDVPCRGNPLSSAFILTSASPLPQTSAPSAGAA